MHKPRMSWHRFDGPMWPAVGPNWNEDILKFRREALSPGYQEKYDRAIGKKRQNECGAVLLHSRLQKLMERLEEKEELFEVQHRRRKPSRTQGGIRLTAEDDE